MQNLLHRTIETGHEYLSPRDEVAPDVLGALRPLVAQALATGAVVAIDAEWSLGCRDHQGRLRAGLWYGAVGPEPHILMTVTRSAGLNPPPHDPERQSARRHAGRVCGVRTGYFAGPGEGRNRPSKKGRETAWAANDSRQAAAGNETASQGWAQ